MEMFALIIMVATSCAGMYLSYNALDVMGDHRELMQEIDERLDYVETLASQGKINDDKKEDMPNVREIQAFGVVQSDESGLSESGGNMLDLSSFA